MKWLVVPTESFSAKGVKDKRNLDFSDLPFVVRKFIEKYPKPFIVLDESSKIKTNTPMHEMKKSSRCRAIKLLNSIGERCIMTGTLMSKSPLNLYDQYCFLRRNFFGEDMYKMNDKYCVLETLRIARGRRILIRPETYETVRKRLKKAYIDGGATWMRAVAYKLEEQYGITPKAMNHILENKKYTPFYNLDDLMSRVSDCTMFVKRGDIFDIANEKFVQEPIARPVEITDAAKKIGKSLVDVGFTDCFTLGNAAALELQTRLQDICNGFEPVKDDEGNVSYKPFKENPKLESLRDLLEEIGVDGGVQVVVWSSRKNMLDACAAMFDEEGWKYVKYTGSENDKEKLEAQEKFANKEVQIFLANQASGGYGLNCLKDCSYAVYMCVDGSVEQFHQSQHRILRGELKSPKFAYSIYAKGSIEERQWERLRIGKELIGEDNRREMFDFV